jgi:ABC-type multidrug transport system fused ATPase/permease subunit
MVVYVFDAGEIKEIGNHESLISQQCVHFHLVKRQLEVKQKDDTTESS